MRKLTITLAAALAIAAAALPAAVGADRSAPVTASRTDTALRPTAIEYGLLASNLDGSAAAAQPAVPRLRGSTVEQAGSEMAT